MTFGRIVMDVGTDHQLFKPAQRGATKDYEEVVKSSQNVQKSKNPDVYLLGGYLQAAEEGRVNFKV